jgi:hypothetical protein
MVDPQLSCAFDFAPTPGIERRKAGPPKSCYDNKLQLIASPRLRSYGFRIMKMNLAGNVEGRANGGA